MFFTCSQLLCALFSLKRVVVGTLPVLLWPRRVSCNDCQQCSRSSLCSLAHCSPMGPTLASAIDYRSDAIWGLLCLFTSNWNCSFNYLWPIAPWTTFSVMYPDNLWRRGVCKAYQLFKKKYLNHKCDTQRFAFVPKKQIQCLIVSHGGFVNTTIVGLTALHTRNPVTDRAHFGWQAHFTRPSPPNYM